MHTTEHILLEWDVREVLDLRQARRVHADIAMRSRLRRRTLELKVIDYYYLSVRSRSRSAELEYVLDLRFVEAPPLRSRHIAWRWIGASLVLLAVTVGIVVHMGSSAPPWWKHEWLGPCVAVLGACAVTTLIAPYRTTETVRLLSTHGRARLLEFTGGVGTLRRIRRFMARLAAHLQLASAARRRTRTEDLRDKMRKVRILAAHSAGAQPVTTRRPAHPS
jgi:hypothetical protein